MKASRSRLTGSLGREPSLQELSRETGLTVEEIALAETATAATESINRETGEDGFSLESVLTDTEEEDRMVEKIALKQAVSCLPDREKQVVGLRYFHGLTQQKTASNPRHQPGSGVPDRAEGTGHSEGKTGRLVPFVLLAFFSISV